MDKGIIIGAESELITRLNLPFVMFRQATSVSCSLYLHVNSLDQWHYSVSFIPPSRPAVSSRV